MSFTDARSIHVQHVVVTIPFEGRRVGNVDEDEADWKGDAVVEVNQQQEVDLGLEKE